MEVINFLNAVLADTGFYCGVSLPKGGGASKQNFYASIEDLSASAQKTDNAGENAYFALATYEQRGSRKVDNVELMKSLYLDIDCGEGKDYPDQRQALAALQGFCKAYQLPKPSFVINSGGGVHVYWALSEQVDRLTWFPVAHKLRTACKEFGLAIDAAITTDAARILRIPGTHNTKFDPPQPVKFLGGSTVPVELDKFAECLPVVEEMKLPAKAQYSEADKADMKNLLGNYTSKFTTIVEKTAKGKGCAHLYHAIKNPNDLSYDEWFSAMSIAKYTEEGMGAVHLISKGHSNYNEQETEKIADSINSPHLCSKFEANNPDRCKGCALKGKIRTPIVIGSQLRSAPEGPQEVVVTKVPEEGKKTPEPTEESESEQGTSSIAFIGGEDEEVSPWVKETHIVPEYPKPYMRGVNGGVYKVDRDSDGDPIETLICERDLYLTGRFSDPELGPVYAIRYHTHREGVRDFTIAQTDIAVNEAFRKAMNINDVLVMDGRPLMAYVAAWVKKLQKTQDKVSLKTQFGWTRDENSFVVGDREIFADRVEANMPSHKTIDHFSRFEKKGTLAEWLAIPEFYNKDGWEQHQYMFGLSFGAPLMAFVPTVSGSVYHLHSQGSGLGKTTGQLGGASVWGKPDAVMIGGTDTAFSMMNRLELYKNLPVYIDELTNLAPMPISNLVYNTSQGYQRNRLSGEGQNKERQRGSQWNLLVGTTANASLLQTISLVKAAPKGEAQRVFEHRATRLPYTEEEATKLNKTLTDQYGHAGDVYIQYVLSHKQEVTKLLSSVERLIRERASLTSKNRMWTSQGACVVVGVILAKRAGLLAWDERKLLAWVIMELSRINHLESEYSMSADDLINAYYGEQFGNVLRIKGLVDARKNGMDVYTIPDSKPHNSFTIRHEYDCNKMYLAVTPFRNWCTKNALEYHGVMEILQRDLGAKPCKVRMLKGTTGDINPCHALQLTFKVAEEGDESVDYEATLG